MSYVFFNKVLGALGKKLEFESISNLYGRTVFDKKDGSNISNIIASANPLVKNGGKQNTGVMGLVGQIKVVGGASKEAQMQSVQKELGDVSWAEGLF